jgi:hypothetical protein
MTGKSPSKRPDNWQQNYDMVTGLQAYCDYSRSKTMGSLYKRVLLSADDPWREMKVLFTNMVAILEQIDEPERQQQFLESALRVIGKNLETTVRTACDTILRLNNR